MAIPLALFAISAHFRYHFNITDIRSLFGQTRQRSNSEIVRIVILDACFVLAVHCPLQNLFFVEDSQRFETVFPIAVDGFLVGAEAGLEDAAGDGRVVDTVTTFAYWETSFSHSKLSRRFIKNPLLQNGEISPHPDPLRRRYMTERAIERRPLPRK